MYLRAEKKELEILEHFLYSLFQIWITFSPIADTAVPYYAIDAFRLNLLVLVFAAASVPFGFLASWLLDTLGLRFSVSTLTLCILGNFYAPTVIMAGALSVAPVRPYITSYLGT